jgi:hypothetical protein
MMAGGAKVKVGIVGATGAVGEEIVKVGGLVHGGEEKEAGLLGWVGW